VRGPGRKKRRTRNGKSLTRLPTEKENQGRGKINQLEAREESVALDGGKRARG